MPSSAWKDYSVAAIAAVVNDKLGLSASDAWALAAHASSRDRHPLLMAMLWSVPLLGASQLAVAGFPMGEPGAYGVVVGEGHVFRSVDPLVTEWLFRQGGSDSGGPGTCCFVSLGRRYAAEEARDAKWSSSSSRRRAGTTLAAWTPDLEVLLSLAGPLVTVTAMAGLFTFSTLSYYGVLYLGCLYLATLISNTCLAAQSGCSARRRLRRSRSSGSYKEDVELEPVKVLVVAPDDRWAVLSGPRDLVETLTVGGSSPGPQPPRSAAIAGAAQLMVVLVILSAVLLEGATATDAGILALALALPHLVARARAGLIAVAPSVRGVLAVRLADKAYETREALIHELSLTAMSDAWAYESGLLAFARGEKRGEKRLGSDYP